MRLLVVLLLVTMSALADPGALRVERAGADVRLRSGAPLQVRTRMVGSKARVDVWPAGTVVGKVPAGVTVTWPESGTVRLEWPAPAGSAARCVQAADGRAVRVVLARNTAARPVTPATVTMDFVEADLVYVIKVLAKAMGRNVYIGPGVEGKVTTSLRSAPPEAALALILAWQEDIVEYKIVSNGSGGQTVIVAPPEKLATIPDDIFCPPPVNISCPPVTGGVRQEILLEKAPAAKVAEFLQSQYKNVQFTMHPTMNGFYVYGTRKDVLQIKAEVPNLDRIPEPPPPPVTEYVVVKYGDVNEVKALLATLVPDVEYEIEPGTRRLSLKGAPGAVDQVKELLAEFDRPTDQIVVDVKLVDVSEGDAKVLGLDDSRPALQVLPRPPFGFYVPLTNTRVLAAPRVATQPDQQGQLHIGEQLAIPWFDPVSAEFASPPVDLGIRVNFVPSLKDGGLTLELDVTTSFITGLVSGQYPCLDLRRNTHRVKVKDADTVVLDNLLPAEAVTAADSYPVLRELPVIGTILQTRKPKSHVVLMLTPHIMR